MATTTNLSSLVINYLTQAQYDEAAANNTLNENQLYLTPTGITAADISRWNSIVSDDKTWNGVSLTKQSTNYGDAKAYVPATNSTTTSNMTYTPYTYTPTAHAIAKYDVNARLYSTTPSANDNSTKVATTAYVDGALNNITTTSTQLIRWTEV